MLTWRHMVLSSDVLISLASLASTVWGDVLLQLSQVQLIAYLATGGGLAAIVFALSVISVPMMVKIPSPMASKRKRDRLR